MIRIDDDNVIIVDKFGYNLAKDRKKKDAKGKPIYEQYSYHTTLEGALKSLCKRKQLENLSDVDVYLPQAFEIYQKTLEDFEDMVARALKGGLNYDNI